MEDDEMEQIPDADWIKQGMTVKTSEMIQFLHQKLVNEEECLRETINENLSPRLKKIHTKGYFQKDMKPDLRIKTDKMWR